jgi:hypothetical protein
MQLTCSALHCSFLGSILEVSNKFGDIVLILLASLTLGNDVLDDILEEGVLLGTDLLEDLWHHVLQFLGLRVSGDDKEVLADRELDYRALVI